MASTEEVVQVVDRLRDLGYVVGLSGVAVGPDGRVLFRLAEQDDRFPDALSQAGFVGGYDVAVVAGKDLIYPPKT